MPSMGIHLDGDNAWPDLRGKVGTPQVIETASLDIAFLAHGMASGKPSVCLRINLPDGRVVLAQTSYALLGAALRAARARYGDPNTD